MKKLAITFLLLASPSFGQTIKIDPTTSYQTMRGWEGVAQMGHGFNASVTPVVPQYPSQTFPNYRNQAIAQVLDLGINRQKLTFRLDDVNATGFDEDGRNLAIRPSTATEGQWHFRRPDSAMDSFVLEMRNALIARGESLYIVLGFVDFRPMGYAAESVPAEYAFMVNKVVAHFKSRYGFLPNAIEAILEPDNPSNPGWTPAKIANNVVAANALLVSNGYTGIRWILPSTKNAGSAASWYAPCSANPACKALVDEVGYHRYDRPPTTTLSAIRVKAAADGNTTMMSEWIGLNHAQMYDDIVSGGASSIEQYTNAFPSAAGDDGAKYLMVDRATWAVTLSTRAKYLRHWLKYVRMDAVRKGVTNSSTVFQGVPFRNVNGTYVVPIKSASGNGTVNVLGLPAGTYGRCVTIGNGVAAPSVYNLCASPVTITAGQPVPITFTGSGAGTVFDVNYLGTPTVGTVTVSGMVATSKGHGLAFAKVSAQNESGQILTALTNGFGRYTIEVEANKVYIVSVEAKGYAGQFPPQMLMVSVSTEVNFISGVLQ